MHFFQLLRHLKFINFLTLFNKIVLFSVSSIEKVAFFFSCDTLFCSTSFERWFSSIFKELFSTSFSSVSDSEKQVYFISFIAVIFRKW